MRKYREAIIYAIFILIGFIYALNNIRPAIVSIFQVETGINKQANQLSDSEKKLDALKKTEQEKQSIVGQAKNIYTPDIAGLDAESSFAVIFDDIIEMTKYNGIKLYSIEYVYNPKDDDFVKGAPDKYNVCQLNMSVIGDYADIESFLKELYKYPYLVNIDKVELSPYPKNKKILLSKMQIILYSSNLGGSSGAPAPAAPSSSAKPSAATAAPAPQGPASPPAVAK